MSEVYTVVDVTDPYATFTIWAGTSRQEAFDYAKSEVTRFDSGTDVARVERWSNGTESSLIGRVELGRVELFSPEL